MVRNPSRLVAAASPDPPTPNASQCAHVRRAAVVPANRQLELLAQPDPMLELCPPPLLVDRKYTRIARIPRPAPASREPAAAATRPSPPTGISRRARKAPLEQLRRPSDSLPPHRPRSTHGRYRPNNPAAQRQELLHWTNVFCSQRHSSSSSKLNKLPAKTTTHRTPPATKRHNSNNNPNREQQQPHRQQQQQQQQQPQQQQQQQQPHQQQQQHHPQQQ